MADTQSAVLGKRARSEDPPSQDTLSSESSFTRLVGPEDDDFVDALRNLPLPDGDEQKGCIRNGIKGVSDAQVDHYTSDATIYGASRFHGFGEYMSRKRAKLQIQNAEMREDEQEKGAKKKSTIFKGIAIYINGWTNPSVQDLRKLIVEHGGIFHAYLDKKSLVTHVITTSLTPAKILEFKNMKVVKPSWLVESANADSLLHWRDFAFDLSERVEESQGRRTAQRTLFEVRPKRKDPSSSAEQDEEPEDSSTSSSQPLSTPPFPLAQPPKAQTLTPPSPPSARDTPKSSDKETKPPEGSKFAATSASGEIPHYAAHSSNLAAQRAMQRPGFHQTHTSVSKDFLAGYYRNSRLHHLSVWKAELKELVAEAHSRAEVKRASQENSLAILSAEGFSMRGTSLGTSPRKAKGKEKEQERVIMHCDFDCFFVSAGLTVRPHLKGKPVVVCHSQGAQGSEASTSEIASSSYEARKFGIRNGMSLGQARQLCPGIATIPYEFELYKRLSLQFYTILMSYADDLQAVSVDEALIDVTTGVSITPIDSEPDPARALAESIRTEIREATGCEVSIGIASNIMLARLATRRAKPAGSFHLTSDQIEPVVHKLDIHDLHGFGSSVRGKAEERFKATTLGQLAGYSRGVLSDALGKKSGEKLYKAIRGIDETRLESDKPRKTVSCEVNFGIRFRDNTDAERFVGELAGELSNRLRTIGRRGRQMSVKVMKRHPDAPVEPPKFMGHGYCETFNRSINLPDFTNDRGVLGEYAWRAISSLDFDPRELRGIGLHVTKLDGQADDGLQAGQSKLSFGSKPKSHPETKDLIPAKQPIGENKQELPEVVEAVPRSRPLAQGFTSKASSSKAVAEEKGPLVSTSSAVLSARGVANVKALSSKTPASKVVVKQEPDLPSFSQVDQTIFAALPNDVREEFEIEYKRRSASPVPEAVRKPTAGSTKQPYTRATSEIADPATFSQVDPTVLAALPVDLQQELRTEYRRRSVSPALKDTKDTNAPKPVGMFPPPKQRSIWGNKLDKPNVKWITRGLAPKNLAIAETRQSKLFTPEKGPSTHKPEIEHTALGISDQQLRELSIEPEVFRALPSRIQHEQVLSARHAKRVVIKPYSTPTKWKATYAPPPQAVFTAPVALMQAHAKKGGKQKESTDPPRAKASQKEDVQDLLEKWVQGCLKANWEPTKRDVDYFGRFLVKCVETDTGMERALAVMKWWAALLRRKWGVQPLQNVEVGYGDAVCIAWWNAFHELKGRMDDVIRAKFGGILSLR